MYDKVLSLYVLFGVPGEDWEYLYRGRPEWELIFFIRQN